MASVTKRRWKKPDGTEAEAWVVRYKSDGTYPQKTFALKKEAEAYKRKVEREIEDGTHVTRRASRTVAQLVDEVILDLERRRRDELIGASYLDQTRRALGYAVEAMGPLVLADLKWQRVEEFGHALRRRKSMHGGRPLSNSTVRVVLNAFRMAVDYGVRRGYAARNVAADAIKEIGALPSKSIETFDQEEMRTVVAAIELPGNSARGQALIRASIYLGTMCGLRRGEIMALTWANVDFARKQIHVRASLTFEDEVKGPKTKAGRRTVPMPSLVAGALEAWKPFVVDDPRGLLFRTRTGGIIRSGDFYKDLWHAVLKRAGFAPVGGRWRHFHATRHFAGSAWLDAGVPLPEVSRLMGHANMAITARIYSHAITEVHHRAAQIESCAGLLSHAGAHGGRMAA